MPMSDIASIQTAAATMGSISAMRSDLRPAGERQSPPAPARPLVAEPVQKPEDPAAVAAIREALVDADLSVGFFQVEGASSPVIRIYNRETGEVVRQIPEEQVLRLRERFTELLGVMADKKA